MARHSLRGIRKAWPLLLLSSWPIGSQADDSDTDIPTVTVVGARTELQDSGIVIHVPVAPLGASDLPELLATLPGVQVRSSGGLGSYSEASLRGSSGRQVRVLLDGLPLDTGGGEATSLSLVSPLLLEQVDIYKGRVPVGLGSGLAGTINLRSRRELAAPVVGAASVGSFGQRQLDLAAQLGQATQLALGAQAARNDFPFHNPFLPFDPNDPDRSDKQRRYNAQTAQYYGLLRYRGPLEVTAHAVDDIQHLPTRANSPNSNAQLDTHSYALSVTTPESADWQTALSHRYTQETYSDPDSQLGLGAQETRSDTQHSLLSIGRHYEQWQDSFSLERTRYTARDAITTVPTAAATRLSIGNGIAAQTGEQRRYNASLQTGWSRDTTAGTNDHYWQIEPALGISQNFAACLATANLGDRQRLPTFFERYGDRGLFRGNPDLKPERAHYGDLGLRCNPGPRLQRLELSFFAQDLHDAISPTYSAQGVGHSVNTRHGQIYGTEFDSAGALSGIGWQLSGTWQHTEDLSDVRATYGKQLPGRFETQLNARLEHRWRQIIFSYAYRLEAGGYYDSPNLLKTPTMQRHDVGMRGAIKQIGWSLQALNLGNSNSEQFNGYPTPGRRVLLSLSYPDTGSAATPAAPSASVSPEGVHDEP